MYESTYFFMCTYLHTAKIADISHIQTHNRTALLCSSIIEAIPTNSLINSFDKKVIIVEFLRRRDQT
jgi:hypothetical protein